MTAMLTALLTVIMSALPAGANTALIGKIIGSLIQIIPIAVKEYQDLVPVIRNIIAALQADPATTAAQLDQLQQLEVQWDAEFEAASAAALAQDAS